LAKGVTEDDGTADISLAKTVWVTSGWAAVTGETQAAAAGRIGVDLFGFGVKTGAWTQTSGGGRDDVVGRDDVGLRAKGLNSGASAHLAGD